MQVRTQKVKTFFNEPGNYLDNNLGIALRSKLIRNCLPELKGKKILDVGCGNGEITLPYIYENNITFIDISERMLDIVKAGIPPDYIRNANFINIDFDQYSSSLRFDYIIVIGLLAHVNSVEKTISKLSSMLEDDGTLIIQFTNRLNLLSLLVRLIFEFKKKIGKKSEYRVNYTSANQIGKLLKNNALTLGRNISYWPALPGFIYLSEKLRKHLYYNLLNSVILRPLGGEKIYFAQQEKKI